MKKIPIILLIFLAALAIQAQTYNLNWSTSFSPAWADGQLNRTASNIGGSLVDCAVTMTKSGGIWAVASSVQSPSTASGLVAGTSPNNIMVALDYNTATQYADAVFTFSTAVNYVRFYIGDVDRYTATSSNFFDKVTITGANGATPHNPTITKYQNSATYPNWIVISGNVSSVNTTNSQASNAGYFGNDPDDGTIDVNFGSIPITSFSIRYDNSSGVTSDPDVQNITIGNISFQKASPMPVSLLSFTGLQKDNKISLEWKTADEVSFSHYIIERGAPGIKYVDLTEIKACGSSSSTATTYHFDDQEAKEGLNLYRLKMVDINGTYTYSKIVPIRVKSTLTNTKVYPTLFTRHFTVEVRSTQNVELHLYVTDTEGKTLFNKSYNISSGLNFINVELPLSLKAGHYIVRTENGTEVKSHTIIKN